MADANSDDTNSDLDVEIFFEGENSSNDSDIPLIQPSNNNSNYLNQQDPLNPSRITFDPSLASSHSYIAGYPEDLRGRTILTDDQTIPLTLLFSFTVLFPGKSLPISFNGAETQFMQKLLKTSNTIAIIPICGKQFSDIGCTAEIQTITRDTRSQFTVCTIGRQRVIVVRRLAVGAAPISERLQNGVVRVLADSSILSLPYNVLSCSNTLYNSSIAAKLVSQYTYEISNELKPDLSRCSSTKYRKKNFNIGKMNYDDTVNNFSEIRVSSCLSNHYRIMKASDSLLSMKRWMLRGFEAEELMSTASSLFLEKLGLLPECLPTELIAFSYKIAGNLPFSNKVLIELLTINCSQLRLRKIISLLKDFSPLLCRSCGTHLSDAKFIFSMSTDGPLANYINPHGVIHDTLTVSQVTGFILNGRASTEFSWFPGYKWTIIICSSCYNHIGWQFEATKSSLNPKKFYGISRTQICGRALSNSFLN